MSMRTEGRLPGERHWGRYLSVIALLFCLLPSTLVAQEESEASTAPSPPAVPAASSLDWPELRAQLTTQYRIVALPEGIGLVPLEEAEGVRLVEVSAGDILINGEIATAEEAAPLLGETTPWVLQLAEASPEERESFAALEPDSSTDSEASEAEDSPSQKKVSRGRTAYGEKLIIGPDERVERAVVFRERLVVKGEVVGDAIAYGANVEILGRVGGDATAVGGDLVLRDGSEVGGDAVSVGGDVRLAEGAVLHGREREVQLELGDWRPSDWLGRLNWEWPERRWHTPFGAFLSMMWNIGGGVIHLLLLAFLACFVYLVAPGRVTTASVAMHNDPWKAGLLGLATFILFWVFIVLLFLLLVASCVGVVLLPVLFLIVCAFLVVSLVGYTAAAHRVGHLVQRRFGISLGGPYLLLLVGVGCIQFWGVLGGALQGFGWALMVVAILFLFFAFVVEFAAWMMGLGGFLLSRSPQDSGPTAPVPAQPPSQPPLPPPAEPTAGEGVGSVDPPESGQ